MRVTVGMIVGQIGAGGTFESVLEDFSYTELEDLFEAPCENYTSNPPTCLSHSLLAVRK